LLFLFYCNTLILGNFAFLRADSASLFLNQMTNKRIFSNVEWVLVVDKTFYDTFCVHPKDDDDFDSPRRFYFVFRDDAERFKELVEKSNCAVPTQLLAVHSY